MCHTGLTFNLESKRCESDVDTSVASSTTSIRVPRDSDHILLETTAVIDYASPNINSELSTTEAPTITKVTEPYNNVEHLEDDDEQTKQLKRKLKWKSRVEEKLKRMQYKGIQKFDLSDNKLIRKLKRGLSNPDRGRQLSTQCPNERLFEFDVKGISIQCRSIQKQYYHIIDMGENVLFCSLEAT